MRATKIQFNIQALAVIMMAWTCHLHAQDPTYSQYQGNEINFNPAYTGSGRDLRVGATYRTLWPNQPGRPSGPLSSYNINADMGIKVYHEQEKSQDFGVGLSAGQDIEGLGYLTTTTFAIPFAYSIKFPNRKRRNQNGFFSAGFRPAVSQIGIDWSRFTYSDQLDPQYGAVRPTSFAQPQLSSHYFFNLDAGVLLRYSMNNGRYENYFEGGAAVANAVLPSIAFSGSYDKKTVLPPRIVISYRSAHRINKKFFLGPLMLFERQSYFYSFKAGLDLFYQPTESPDVRPFEFGSYMRTGFANGNDTRSLIIYLGHKGLMKSRNNKMRREAGYSVGFSADFTIGGLRMQTAGAYELTVGFMIPTRGAKDQDCFW